MSGITLKESDPIDIPTPDTNKNTIFIDSTVVPPAPAYKDDAGVVRALKGSIGSQGPVGPIGFGIDGEAGEFLVSQPGPQGAQGNAGLTGAQGPVGPIIIGSDGEDGEQGFPGLPGVAGSSASSDILKVRVVLTDAQIKSLSSVPRDIIAAPGAGKFINIIACITMRDTTLGAYSAAPNFSIRYNGQLDELVSIGSLFLSTANKRWNRFDVSTVGSTNNAINLSVQAKLAADVTGGNAANYLLIELTYTIVTDGP